MNTLVVYSHPVEDSFCSALLAAVTERVRAEGHEMRLRDLYAEGFDPRVDADEYALHLEPPDTKPQLGEHFKDLLWAQRLILVYPTWWGAQPAMLKGWFERVFAHGVAWEFGARGNLVGLLTNLESVVAVTTHGSSKWVNVLQGEAGKRAVKRGMRIFAGPRVRIRWVAHYGIDRDRPRRRQAFLKRVPDAVGQRA